ncbi:MAG TPA: ribosome-binding factor A [Candidatus Paceibacterota bacterium]|nr:ribosome-binding factor A [Candidatus Paceibacterota bacterium]
MSVRDDKAASLLVHLAAEYIAREAGRQTLITPTRADVSPDRKNATVYVSVFPDADTEHAVEFLTRHADDFRSFIKKEARFSFLPRVRFEADLGEKHRQHLDDISRQIREG